MYAVEASGTDSGVGPSKGWKGTQIHGLGELMPAVQFLRIQFPLD